MGFRILDERGHHGFRITIISVLERSQPAVRFAVGSVIHQERTCDGICRSDASLFSTYIHIDDSEGSVTEEYRCECAYRNGHKNTAHFSGA